MRLKMAIITEEMKNYILPLSDQLLHHNYNFYD
jgi:hypothetical protein